MPSEKDRPEARPGGFDRRGFLKGLLGVGLGGGAAAAGARFSMPERAAAQGPGAGAPPHGHASGGHGQVLVRARADDAEIRTLGRRVRPHRTKNPMEVLTTFDRGTVTRLPGGKVLREYAVIAEDAEIEVAKGVFYPAWTFNGSVPGPTLRATYGDRIRIHFFNRGSMPHTIHFHGIHSAEMDGVFEIVPSGGRFVYEFTAEPFGVHLYHCHVTPLKKHIEKGLYGAFIVDPPEPRPPAREMVMVMNGFDTDVDGENEFYTVNGVANYFAENHIPLRTGELNRIYLVNVTEFDQINSMHIHAEFFRLYRTGTRLDQYEISDTVMLCQGERCVLEFTYKFPGRFMFHAHQSEFAELGWMGFFRVEGPPVVA